MTATALRLNEPVGVSPGIERALHLADRYLAVSLFSPRPNLITLVSRSNTALLVRFRNLKFETVSPVQAAAPVALSGLLPGGGNALVSGAGSVPPQAGLVQEEVATHLNALRGWAKISATQPPAVPSDPEFPQAPAVATVWRLFDELLLSLLRGAPDPARERIAGCWRTRPAPE